jgi:Flp pilus assembly pilin Flp
MNELRALWRDDDGAAHAETAILVALVALAGVGLWQHLGNTTTNSVAESADMLKQETGTPLVDANP